ncbi:MAG: NADH-quinone oxidoreductase subunit J [Chloroflexi bacterium]|nr:NADH-quinone oxidoreductase subunit J [Chloroflexota bacterium]
MQLLSTALPMADGLSSTPLAMVGLAFRIASTEQVVFYILAAVAVGGALGVVLARDIVHAALFLVVALVMTAGVYVLLSAEFLSLVQILLYGGGVSILVLFAVMITRVRDARGPLEGPQRPFAVIAGLAIVAMLVLMIVRSDWRNASAVAQQATGSPEQIYRVRTQAGADLVFDHEAIGYDLFTTYAVPFELASLVLLIALVGAIVLSRGEEDEVA